LFWIYAPGLINDIISVDGVSRLTGMEVGILDENPVSSVEINCGNTVMEYKGTTLSPYVYVKQGADSVFGRTKDGFNVLCERREPHFTTVLCCVPPAPWQVVQYFAKNAGVHIYSEEGDVVYANQSYLSVSSSRPGKRRIRLPGKFQLTGLLGDEDRKKYSREHEIDFSAGSCRFFKISEKRNLNK